MVDRKMKSRLDKNPADYQEGQIQQHGPLIVTGMHRSGTSLVASLLQAAGVHMGDRQLGPDRGNPRGHFEDVGFYRFHDGILKRAGLSLLVQEVESLGVFTPQDEADAKQLIEARRKHVLWGWKDPRTTFFLHCWQALLPQAKYVFLYRHPLEVALSLLRRGTDMEALVEPVAALRSWQVHNQAILDFYREHSSACLLANISHVAHDMPGFIGATARKFGLPLQFLEAHQHFHPDELNQLTLPAQAIAILKRLSPQVVSVYDQLEDVADWSEKNAAPPKSNSNLARQWKKITQVTQTTTAFDGAALSKAIEFVLARLDPDALVEGKAALDQIRRTQLAHLEQVVAEKDVQQRSLQAQVETLTQQLALTQQVVASKDLYIQGVTAQAKNLEQVVANKDNHLQELTTHAHALESLATDRQAQISGLTGQLHGIQQALLRADKHTESLMLQIHQLEQETALKEAHARELMAHVQDLQQVATAKDAQLHELTAHVQQLEQSALSKDARLLELAGHVQQLEYSALSKDARLHELAAQVQQLEQSAWSKDARLQELAAHVQQLEHSALSKDAHTNNLDQLVASKESQVQQLTARLGVVENSRWWGMALKWYAFRFRLRRLWAGAGLPARQPQRPVALANVLAPSPTHPPAKLARASHSTRPKVLFISHDAGRHGAQILLLNFLRWFKANSATPFEILLKRGGELAKDFEALAPVHVWGGVGAASDDVAHQHGLIEYFRQANIGLVYSNTITNGEVLGALAGLNCPVICHVHELDHWINYQTSADNTALIKRHTTHYIAVSQAVRRVLAETLAVDDGQMEVVYEFAPISTQHVSNPLYLHQKLNLPQEAQVVGGSGTTDWRKGPDIFVQLAATVLRHNPHRPIHFVWVGGESAGPVYGQLQHDIHRLGLDGRVHFLGAHPNPADFFAGFDVFALVSREDPFPLVSLEAAALGKPVVCFDGSGGAKEFIETDSGFVVPYLNVDVMADRVLELLTSEDLRQRMGQCAAQKVRERYTVKVVGPQLAEIIKQFMLPVPQQVEGQTQ